VTLDELCSLRVAVWGLGQEGQAMVRLLAGRGVQALLIDDRPQTAGTGADPTGAAVVHAPGSVRWDSVDVVVRSPGVGRYRPELEAAGAAGVAVTTAMALWLEDFADARVVAVTGTKGKSTTATLAAAILREDGLDVALIGNIGVPVTETYGAALADAYVVEVSSYQAADVTVSPGVCVLTSLAPDHLDWHGGVEAYYRDKLRLVEAGPPGALAVNAGSPEAVRRTARHPDRVLFGPEGRVRVTGGAQVEVDGVPLADGSGLGAPGRHNLWNLCGAVAGSLLLNGHAPSAGAVAHAVEGFAGLPSRCRTIGERHGVTYVDDALASNPFATMASVEAFARRDLTVIIGGADRGVDPTGMIQALADRRPAPRVIVLPPDPERLAAPLERLAAAGQGGRSGLSVEVASGIDDAVRRARSATPAGGVVLFSPAAPTPEGEGGFAARGRQFAEAAGLTVAAR
jgi:UDP-N-acetylmuramoylalanine--D-glutamate ligase